MEEVTIPNSIAQGLEHSKSSINADYYPTSTVWHHLPDITHLVFHHFSFLIIANVF